MFTNEIKAVFLEECPLHLVQSPPGSQLCSGDPGPPCPLSLRPEATLGWGAPRQTHSQGKQNDSPQDVLSQVLVPWVPTERTAWPRPPEANTGRWGWGGACRQAVLGQTGRRGTRAESCGRHAALKRPACWSRPYHEPHLRSPGPEAVLKTKMRRARPRSGREQGVRGSAPTQLT